MSGNSPEELGFTRPDPEKPPRAPRPPTRYRVRFPLSSSACRFCPGRIVWEKLASGATMPLSLASREPWIEDGREIGALLLPHFADCPNWPKRQKRKP